MTESDFLAQFKAAQREGWASFVPLETFTTPPAASLIDFAGVQTGDRVLDVACGTGVVAVTAARRGAQVKGLDLSPVLLERARWNAQTAGVEIEFTEGDVEKLPYADASFDTVVSQFGHMFAPRPEVAVAEMLRVLKKGGRIAFSTWPPELFTGAMFTLVNQYLPMPAGIVPPPAWGDPNVVRERLGEKVTELVFNRELMVVPALSPQHYRSGMETTAAPVIKLTQMLKDEPAKLSKFRNEFERLASNYMKNNTMHQSFLMTRAFKR